jgi:catalase-peroxidase
VLSHLDFEAVAATDLRTIERVGDRVTHGLGVTDVDDCLDRRADIRAVAGEHRVKVPTCGHARFVKDFVRVWNKVMMLDRFDVKS